MQRKLLTGLFLLSGTTGLIYETVWIRLFALNFGSTAQALSTVAAVFLGGLALGAWLAGRISDGLRGRALALYGAAELLAGAYALLIPILISKITPLLVSVYASGDGSGAAVTILRAGYCALILLPATILMGATLPLLAEWAGANNQRGLVSSLYAVNLAGATCGALFSGFSLLPALGFTGTLRLASAVNIAIGAVAIGAAFRLPVVAKPDSVLGRGPALPLWTALAFLSGFLCMLYEVVWARVFGLLFGSTISTVTLTLGAFLLGLAIAAVAALRIRKQDLWLLWAQAASVVLLLTAVACASAAPAWIADWVRTYSGQPSSIELMKAGVLALMLTPLAAAAGLVFPLLLRVVSTSGSSLGRGVGNLYGINTLGCIVGSLVTGWILIPLAGTQTTVLLGGSISLCVAGVLVFQFRPAWKMQTAVGALACIVAGVLIPGWSMDAMTAGVYKYAPYAPEGSLFGRGQLVYVREGVSGTVAVRKEGSSTILSIDGKVDATDSGGDLITEKLLAHLPLLLARDPKNICLIGLASGVTAGAALTHPIKTLDVLELSKEVREASHYFDTANGRPLEDRRTRVVMNDGRNHLVLASAQYDVIISEPSNPWITGMNNLFTEDFFRIAKARLRPGGLFAQWFHIYNMPGDDLRSLLRAFHEVFPNAALWRLNDGDVLLTGFESAPAWPTDLRLPEGARADLLSAGIADPTILWDMYVMRDADLERFSSDALPNTDDHPWLEFHGQRDLHAQTDLDNVNAFDALANPLPAPAFVGSVRRGATFKRRMDYARTFEKAESLGSAYKNYLRAHEAEPSSIEALAGMDRCSLLPVERAAVASALGVPIGTDTAAQRIQVALERSGRGDKMGAAFLFAENIAAHPKDAAARFNFGVFSLEQKNYSGAVELFQQAIEIDPTNIPAHEAIAEVYLQQHNYAAAAQWSRRILQLDPRHATALQILAALEREHRN